ncbi:MAG: cardiolipin synthase [Opitutaceae bacterium]
MALATIPSVLVRRHGRPLAALSWILALLTIPFGGVFGWWLLGRTHLRRKTAERQASSARICKACPFPVSTVKELDSDLRQMLPFAVQGRRWKEGVFPPASGTGIQVFGDGLLAFTAMEEAIDNARHEIRLLFYIWNVDETGRRFAKKLIERSRSGVSIRVLLDGFGCRPFLRILAPSMRQAGIEIESFASHFWTPTWNFRNHRKLLLVDGSSAFTGGMNIGSEYELDWRDLMLEFHGAVVYNLDDVFREDWGYACGRTLDRIRGGLAEVSDRQTGVCTVVASGPDRSRNRVHDGFFLSISSARARVWLSSPYFIPSPPITASLCGAAQRGVDVRLLLPHRGQFDLLGLVAQSYLPDLIDEGVRVFEYLPRFLHAKSLIVDDRMAFVGSANTDSRSFRLNFELGCFIQSHEVNSSLSELYESNLSESVEIRAIDLASRPIWMTCMESAAQLLSPLL